MSSCDRGRREIDEETILRKTWLEVCLENCLCAALDVGRGGRHAAQRDLDSRTPSATRRLSYSGARERVGEQEGGAREKEGEKDGRASRAGRDRATGARAGRARCSPRDRDVDGRCAMRRSGLGEGINVRVPSRRCQRCFGRGWICASDRGHVM